MPGKILFTTAGPNVRRNTADIPPWARNLDALYREAVQTTRAADALDAANQARVDAGQLPDDGAIRELTRHVAAVKSWVDAQDWYSYNNEGPPLIRWPTDSKWFRARKVRGNKRKAPAKRRNAGKSVADPVAAHELELYIENEPALVAASNSLGKLIMRNLARMILRGTYDSTKAWKAWMPLADEGGKRYLREYGDRFGTGFNKATREMVANSLAEAFESDVRLGAINPEALVGAVANPRTRRR